MHKQKLRGIIGLATELGLTMGLTVAGLVVGSLYLGRRLDAWLGIGPLGTIASTFGGAIASQLAVYAIAARAVERVSADAGHARQAIGGLALLGVGLRTLSMITLPGVLGLALGAWIDRTAGTGATATILLTLLGPLAGLCVSVRMLRARRKLSDRAGSHPCSKPED